MVETSYDGKPGIAFQISATGCGIGGSYRVGGRVVVRSPTGVTCAGVSKIGRGSGTDLGICTAGTGYVGGSIMNGQTPGLVAYRGGSWLQATFRIFAVFQSHQEPSVWRNA